MSKLIAVISASLLSLTLSGCLGSGSEGARGSDGAPGAQGVAGAPGARGEAGTNGVDASPCSVEQIGEDAQINCPDGTSALVKGNQAGPAEKRWALFKGQQKIANLGLDPYATQTAYISVNNGRRFAFLAPPYNFDLQKTKIYYSMANCEGVTSTSGFPNAIVLNGTQTYKTTSYLPFQGSGISTSSYKDETTGLCINQSQTNGMPVVAEVCSDCVITSREGLELRFE